MLFTESGTCLLPSMMAIPSSGPITLTQSSTSNTSLKKLLLDANWLALI